ncbi:MAG: ATP-binding cassette domain-containing protein [Clostridiales bacterium]|nr:ATP-binding cassette domain-containing protein [Clostridiales bacterium]
MPDIILEGVSKIYKDRHRGRWRGRLKAGDLDLTVRAAEDLDLTIRQGEFVFVVGSSGAGKSTLLRLISGGVKPDKGKVYLDGYSMDTFHSWNRSYRINVFGQVWQEPTLVRKKTVEENLRLVANIHDWMQRGPHKAVKERVNKVLGLVGMSGSNDLFPVELSGGEVRRVELARALINSPSILVLDEITNNLDDDNIWDILQLLIELNEKGTTIIMATHASQYVNIMCRRVITLVNGRIRSDVQRGKYGDMV